MPVLRVVTTIHAPVRRCFDLARSVDAHVHSARSTGETVMGEDGSVMRGLLEPGQAVTFRARHFGVWQRLTSHITVFDSPGHFRDSQVRGAFRRFDHDHFFAATSDGCIMTDVWNYDAPFGLLGDVAEVFVLNAYLRRFLARRGQELKMLAEGEEWRRFVPE